MKILVVDNYDSFTYNLVHLVEKITGEKPTVRLNDKINSEEGNEYDKIILSPGPGIPSEAGSMPEFIKKYARSKPLLGVCLGHQAIGEAFGAKLVNTDIVYHGVATKIIQLTTRSVLFKGMNDEFEAGRYHSWIIDRESLPAEFDITAVDVNGYIMAMQHKQLDIHSVQFHPESILTPGGEIIMRNWLKK